MATRAIVTSPPVVACNVCGRRLLRGENPDVFLAGGERRTVCELCVPRAAAEGWLREADSHEPGVSPPRPRRAGSLFGRLRQLREPQERPPRRAADTPRRRTVVESEDLYDDDGVYAFLEGAVESAGPNRQIAFAGSSPERHPPADPEPSAGEPEPTAGEPDADLPAARPREGSGDSGLEQALRVFNEGEIPQRVAGISRSLGAATVVVRQLADSRSTVAIVVAWELCWYRYEIELDEEIARARLVAEGMELDELPAEDRVANALADERGELALTAV
jgi:hypothetical protein